MQFFLRFTHRLKLSSYSSYDHIVPAVTEVVLLALEVRLRFWIGLLKYIARMAPLTLKATSLVLPSPTTLVDALHERLKSRKVVMKRMDR